MKHFVGFLIAIGTVVFLYSLNKENRNITPAKTTNLRVYSYSSFTQSWGPGPLLKQKFKEKTGIDIDFVESPDSGVLLQRLKLEGPSLGADIVIGLDQYDLKKALAELQWKKIDFADLVKGQGLDLKLENDYFVPYDWGIFSFIARKGTLPFEPKSLDDLLDPRLKGQIAFQDPRTSSPGLQFLFWVHDQKKSGATDYLQNLIPQAHSFSSSWSQAYGLFQKKQALLVFSYITSTLYHEIEEKNFDTYFLHMKEPHPVQFEFLGIPEFCRQCAAAEEFVNFMLSKDGQKVLMEKNYMFPILKDVMSQTPFEKVMSVDHLMPFQIPSSQTVEDHVSQWAKLRRQN